MLLVAIALLKTQYLSMLITNVCALHQLTSMGEYALFVMSNHILFFPKPHALVMTIWQNGTMIQITASVF